MNTSRTNFTEAYRALLALSRTNDPRIVDATQQLVALMAEALDQLREDVDELRGGA